MIKKIACFFIVISSLLACGEDETKVSKEPEGDVDATRMLLRAVLDGRWKDAKTLVVQDETNLQYLDATERRFTRMSPDSVRNYRQSEIHFFNTRQLSDSARIITYSNSFTNEKDSIKVVRVNKRWVVDFKFKFQNTQ